MRRHWKFAAVMTILGSVGAIAGAAEVRLALKTAPADQVLATQTTDSGALYAVVQLGTARAVCFQDGGTTTPHRILDEGAFATGPFHPEVPLNPAHGSEFVMVRTEGTGSGGSAILIDSLGRVIYRLSPGNYPAHSEPLTLAGCWTAGLPVMHPEETKGEKSVEKMMMVFYFATVTNEVLLGYLSRLPAVSSDLTAPILFALSNLETQLNLSRVANRLQTFMPFFTSEDQALLLMWSKGDYANDPPGKYFVRPVGFALDEGGHIQTTWMPVRTVEVEDTPISSPHTPNAGTVRRVLEGGTFDEEMNVMRARTTASKDAVLVGEQSTQPVPPPVVHDVSKKPPVDCKKADLNGDGKVDGDDMTLLIDYSLDGDLRGDLDGDGVVGSDDISYMNRAIKKCNETDKETGRMVWALMIEGMELPGLIDQRLTDVRAVRANGYGASAFLVQSATSPSLPATDVLYVLDRDGFQLALKSGDDLGDGPIVSIGDDSARRGVGEINHRGFFHITAQLADGATAVYRVQARNSGPGAPAAMGTSAMVRAIVGADDATATLDHNTDGTVDSADLRTIILMPPTE